LRSPESNPSLSCSPPETRVSRAPDCSHTLSSRPERTGVPDALGFRALGSGSVAEGPALSSWLHQYCSSTSGNHLPGKSVITCQEKTWLSVAPLCSSLCY